MYNGLNAIKEFGDFRLDVGKKTLWHDGQPVQMPLKEIELLCLLVETPGELVTKNEILDKIWEDSFVEESNLSRHVYLLRKTLKGLGTRNDLIENVPRRGYRFTGEVRPVPSGELVIEKHTKTQTLIKVEDEPGDPVTTRTRTLGRLPAVAAALVLVAVIGVAAFIGYRGFSPEASISQIRSIGVLPLKSFGKKSEDEELRMRITDALITNLGHLKEVSVRPTNSVLGFAGEDTEAIGAGRQLNVDAVLDGRIHTEGESLRVTLQLISVPTGEQLWSGQFDGKRTEILSLQDKISAALLPELSPTKQQSGPLVKNPTANAEAYELYLKGRYLWNKRNVQEMKKALPYFERAIALDPNFALAYAGMADAISMLTNHDAFPRFEGYGQAKRMAYKAMEIDPALSEAYSALGWVLFKHEWNWPEAEKAFAKAIELNANNAEAHHWRGLNFRAQGKTDEFIASMDKARLVSPLTKPISQNYYAVVMEREGCARGLEYLENMYTLYGFSDEEKAYISGYHHVQCGSYAQAIELIENTPVTHFRFKTLGALGAAYAKAGHRKKALEILERIKKKETDETIKFYVMPYIYTALGDFDSAFANLEKAIELRDDRLTNLKSDHFLAPLRTDPRFNQLLKKVNLPEGN